MADKIERIYDRFNKGVSELIVNAKAASIDAQVDCIYPESFIVAIVGTGANEVNITLNKMDVNLDETLDVFKKELSKKRAYNEVKNNISHEDLKISKQVIDICKKADELRESVLPDQKNAIAIRHMFLALLSHNDFCKNYFFRNGVMEETFVVNFEEKSFNDGREAVTADGERKYEKTKGKVIRDFCSDLTQMAKDKKLDPIISREKEIEKTITILCRRGKNNPILLGQPGVGKTAIVEGIAQRIVEGDVPKQLMNCKLYSLSMNGMVAGTKYRGEFEERIQSLVKEIQKIDNCILFIDEIHTLIGAGAGSGSSLDASNILKPFLARNDLRCIGATTLDDFKHHFRKDGALTRRFQQVTIEEPTLEQMKTILDGIKSQYEKYHNCIIDEEAIEAIIELSNRYMPDRNFPDKAIDCIDMSCAQYAWRTDGKIKKISKIDVANVISEYCKIPVEVMMWDGDKRIKTIEKELIGKIVGQNGAIDAVCKSLKNAYSGIRNPDRPIGNFIFGGPSGTGKTYMAKELSNIVFGNDKCFIRLDMTEFSEPHSISKLIGSPPGYVGFQETDVLIDKIKRNPYCILLIDELEKAHPDVIRLFLQVMSDGLMTDANGNKADFKNAVIIMTGNFGLNEKEKSSMGFSENVDVDLFKNCHKRLVSYCKDKYGMEFVNRIDEFIPFMPLSDDNLKTIAKIRLDEISGRLAKRKLKVSFNNDVVDLMIKLSKEEHSKNANVINRLVAKNIENCVSDAIMSSKTDFIPIKVFVKDEKFEWKKVRERIKKVNS